MNIHTLWCMRVNEDIPELLVAWDEYSRNENPEGFEAEIDAAEDGIRKYEPRTKFRQIDLEVPLKDVEDKFYSESISASVKGP